VTPGVWEISCQVSVISWRSSSRCECLGAAGGDRQVALPGVVGRGLPADQAELVKAPQHAAEIAGVEAEVAHDVGRGRAFALPDLVEHARLGERERAFEPVLAQHAEVLRVEPIETAHRGEALRPLQRGGTGHGGIVGQILD
jgi:hypothetical protein